jgi:hypothetical protein
MKVELLQLIGVILFNFISAKKGYLFFAEREIIVRPQDR